MNTLVQKFVGFSLMLMMSVFLFIGAATVHAGTTDNMTGQAWSQNIGWIYLNSCDDPTDSNTCDASNDYGVSYDPVTDSYSGDAWNENIGYIDFGTVGPFGENADAQTGGSAGANGWLGMIDMDGVTYAGPRFTGYAFSGEDLDADGIADIGIGWIDFSPAGVVSGCTASEATNHEPLAVHDDGSCVIETIGNWCQDAEWSSQIETEQDFKDYNETAEENGTERLVREQSTGLCTLESDVCPANMDTNVPNFPSQWTPGWVGVQTLQKVEDYNSDYAALEETIPEIIMHNSGGYCFLEDLPIGCTDDSFDSYDEDAEIHDQDMCWNDGDSCDPTKRSCNVIEFDRYQEI